MFWTLIWVSCDCDCCLNTKESQSLRFWFYLISLVRNMHSLIKIKIIEVNSWKHQAPLWSRFNIIQCICHPAVLTSPFADVTMKQRGNSIHIYVFGQPMIVFIYFWIHKFFRIDFFIWDIKYVEMMWIFDAWEISSLCFSMSLKRS